MSTGIRRPWGKEDIEWHDPATDGTAESTFTRPASNPLNPDVNVTRISAQSMTLLDAPVTAGWNTPFEGLADTAAAKTVELALKDIRKNIPHYRNVEHYGMIPNAANSTDADKNRAVWDQIISDIGTSGDGIFFPAGNWIVDGTAAGSPILTSSKSGITIVGTGFGSVLKAYASNSGTDLINFSNASNIRVSDLTLDKNTGTTGACFMAQGTGGGSPVGIGQIRVLNVATSAGQTGININGAGGHANGIWVENCFLDADGKEVWITDALNINLVKNLVNHTGAATGGFNLLTGGTVGNWLGSINVDQNILLTTGTITDVFVSRNVTYTGGLHDNAAIWRNKISQGSLSVTGINVVEMAHNEIGGGISYQCSTMSSVRNFRALYNYLGSSSSSGIYLNFSDCNVDDVEIVGGRVYKAANHGIYIIAGSTGATYVINGVRIHGGYVLDCSDSATNTYDGIRATMNHVSVTANNWMLGPVSMKSTGAKKHEHGVHFDGAGTWANCKRWGVLVNGYGTAAASYPAGWADMAALHDIP